jgi:group I intron endonuclease
MATNKPTRPVSSQQDHPTFAGVYAITHLASEYRYVGSARNIAKRWSRHRGDLNGNQHHCPYLQRVWNKHGGAAAFKFEILEACLDEPTILVSREQWWIDHFKDKTFNTRKFAEPFCAEWARSPDGKALHQQNGKFMKQWWKTWKLNQTYTGTCKGCGKEFTTSSTRRDVKFCSSNCSHRVASKEKRWQEERICVICQKPFITARHGDAKACPGTCGSRLHSPLNPEDIPKILKRIADGEHLAKIASDFGVTGAALSYIGRRQCWADIPVSSEIEQALQQRFSGKSRRKKLTHEQVKEIKRRLRLNPDHQVRLAEEFGISPTTLSEIKTGKTFSNVE